MELGTAITHARAPAARWATSISKSGAAQRGEGGGTCSEGNWRGRCRGARLDRLDARNPLGRTLPITRVICTSEHCSCQQTRQPGSQYSEGHPTTSRSRWEAPRILSPPHSRKTRPIGVRFLLTWSDCSSFETVPWKWKNANAVMSRFVSCRSVFQPNMFCMHAKRPHIEPDRSHSPLHGLWSQSCPSRLPAPPAFTFQCCLNRHHHACDGVSSRAEPPRAASEGSPITRLRISPGAPRALSQRGRNFDAVRKPARG